jgi:hypothetical protein
MKYCKTPPLDYVAKLRLFLTLMADKSKEGFNFPQDKPSKR